MASAKEIKQKINSISKTRQITKAMEMVAVSKMRKANHRMSAGKEYAEKIKQVINHLTKANMQQTHPFLEQRKEKKIGIIVISSDRGLCGGLNNNLFKELLQKITKLEDEKIEFCFAALGTKAINYFTKMSGEIVGCVSKLGDKPTLANIIGPVNILLDLYKKSEIDTIYLAHNKFVNTMDQKPKIEKLVPVPSWDDEQVVQAGWDYIYEPSSSELLEKLLNRYIETLVYQGVVENLACEQAARMVAMKSASDNANEIIASLNLAYNKARQSAITQELSEIVAGAAAV